MDFEVHLRQNCRPFCKGRFLKLKVNILCCRIRQQLTVKFVSETLQIPLVQQLEVISQADPPARKKNSHVQLVLWTNKVNDPNNSDRDRIKIFKLQEKLKPLHGLRDKTVMKYTECQFPEPQREAKNGTRYREL